VRSSAAAEKDGERMALKILTRAEDIPDDKDNVRNQATENGREQSESVHFRDISVDVKL
jgi:hypothetical protein